MAGGPVFQCAPETVERTEALTEVEVERMIEAGALQELAGASRRELYDALVGR